jgi:hypothetical protein
MNIPTNILKSNYFPSEKIQYHQKLAKRYHKQIQKQKNISQSKPNMGSLKEDIINWFFSFDVITKLIISCIENRWLTNILHQLFIQHKANHRLRFQFRGEESISEIIPQLIPSGVQIINSTSTYELGYINYFTIREESRVSPDRSITENLFLQKDINFYKTEDSNLSDQMSPCHKYSNYFCLAYHMIEDEGYFRKMFDTFSGGLAFTSPIPCDYDQKSKTYNFGLPSWMSNKEFYSVTEYFVAFFEQVITMRYFLDDKNLKKINNIDIKNVSNNVTSIINTTNSFNSDNFIYLNKLLNEKNNLTKFIKREFALDVLKLCDALDLKNLIEEVKNDYRIKEIIKSKTKGQEYITYNGILYNNFLLYDENDLLSSNELEKKIKQYFGCFKTEEELIDCLLFTSLETIFTYDDFLMERIFESLLDKFAQKNANDLINGIFENDEVAKKKKKNNKKKITNNTNTNISNINGNTMNTMSTTINNKDINNINNTAEDNCIKFNEEDIDIEMGLANTQSSFSFINKNIKKEACDFIRGEFMGGIMMVRTSSSNLHEETCTNGNKEEIKKLVKEVVEKLLKNVNHCIDSLQGESSEETINTDHNRKGFDDKDTAYSSANMSDNNSKTKDNDKRKRSKQNNYKLYDFKLKDKKEVKKVESIKHNSLKEADKKELQILADSFKRDRVQSTNTYPPKTLQLDSNSNGNNNYQAHTTSFNQMSSISPTMTSSKFQSQNNTPIKAATTSSFQININSKEFDVNKRPFRKYDNFNNHHYPNSNNFYFKNNHHNNFNRYYYDLSMMNNFYYFNGHNSFNELFFFRFQKYIINYTETVENNLNNLKDAKTQIITSISELIKTCLSKYLNKHLENNCKINTEIYGSFASGLAIESSDIDISVKYEECNEDVRVLMSRVVDCLKLTGKIEGINPIFTASVPVIKLVRICLTLDNQPFDLYRR